MNEINILPLYKSLRLCDVVQQISLIHFVSVDCIWGQFVPEECSVSCGTGTQTKTRTILAEEQYGGEPCKGETSIVEQCDMGDCPIEKPGSNMIFIYDLNKGEKKLWST